MKWNGYIRETILINQPHVIALLSCDTATSHLALAHVLESAPSIKKFLEAIIDIPSLVAQIQSSAFLKCFFQSQIPNAHDKNQFAKIILTTDKFVIGLQPRDIALLVFYSKYYEGVTAPTELTEILPVLFKANKITGNLLVELARLDEPEYVGNYALIISTNEQARAMLAKLQNISYAFEITKIAVSGCFSKGKACPLLIPEIIKNFTVEERKSLHAIAEPINQQLLKWYILPEKPVLHFPSSQKLVVNLENDSICDITKTKGILK